MEVEEGRESSSWEEKKEVKSKSQPPLEKGPLLSLLSDKGSRLHQCGGSRQERERERVHDQNVYRGAFSHAMGPNVTVGCIVACVVACVRSWHHASCMRIGH
jgi:hypothetical protein